MTETITYDDAGASTIGGNLLEATEELVPEPAPSAGSLIGRYIVLERLGTGGMGVVLAAYDPELDRKVAVKLMRAPEGESLPSGGAASRLVDEARALAQLSHPNVITVHDVGVHKGRVFVAMELIEGQTLAAWRTETPRTIAELCRVYLEAGEGLRAAHRAGLVHRDFKPENVMIDREGRIRVLDFGLARGTRRNLEASDLDQLRIDDPRTIGLVGTPAYMAPEQLSGEHVDARSDQFSFCVALWEALFDARPFRGQTIGALVWSALHDTPEVPARTKVSPRISAALVRGLAKAPEDRFPSMDDLLRELAPEPSTRASWRLGVAAGIGGIVAVAAFAVWPDRPDACAGVDDLSAIWGPTRSAALERALGEGDEAALALSNTQHALDGYTSRLATGLRHACEMRETAADADPEPRSRCLERRRVAVENAIAFMIETPDSTRARGPEIVGALPRVEDCNDPSAIDQPNVDDPARIERIDALEARLDAAKFLLAAGGRNEAESVLEEVLATTTAEGLPWVAARALFLQAAYVEAHADETRSADIYRRCFVVALEADRETMSAMCAARLAVHYGFDDIDVPQAEHWLAVARGIATRRSPTGIVSLEVLIGSGTLALAKGDNEAALAAFERAAQRCRELATDNPATCARTIQDVADTLALLDREQEALEAYDRALALVVERHGETHPQSLILRNQRAVTMGAAGHREDAVAEMRRVAELGEAYWGADSPKIIPLLGNLADALTAMGAFDEAAASAERVLRLTEAERGRDHLMMSYALLTRGHVALLQGRWDAARSDLEGAIAIRQRLYGAEHPSLTSPRIVLAQGHLWAGDPATALPMFDALIAACAKHLCEQQDSVLKAARIEALAHLGRTEEARAALTTLRSELPTPIAQAVRARVELAAMAVEARAPTAAQAAALREGLIASEGVASLALMRLDRLVERG